MENESAILEEGGNNENKIIDDIINNITDLNNHN